MEPFAERSLAPGRAQRRRDNSAVHKLQESKCSFDDLLLAPATLAELVNAIEEGVVSGKIGKQVLPALLQVRKCGQMPTVVYHCTTQQYILCGIHVLIVRKRCCLHTALVRCFALGICK